MQRFRLEPGTEPGRRFCALAEQHATEAAKRAAEHDRDATFPVEAIDAMKQSGFAAAIVPEEFGGVGVSSVRDLAIGVSCLARGDASLAIAMNMHFAASWVVTRNWRAAVEAGDEESAAGSAMILGLFGSGTLAMANATEAGTDIRHPMAELTKIDGGWRLDGRKAFGTLSPVADVFAVACRSRRPDGSWAGGRAIVFRDSPGQTILDNWDALGMRASGSHDIVYENCVVPDGLYYETGDWGALGEEPLIIGTAGSIGLVGAFLGIAEAAREYIAHLLCTRTKQPTGEVLAARTGIQHAMAELEIDLATCRAHVHWIGGLLDRDLVDRPVASVSREELLGLFATFQASKLVAMRKAIEVVDKALQLSGGAGYMQSNPLSRYYRDVRAGPFMQPLSPNEAYGAIGQIVLGREPTVDN